MQVPARPTAPMVIVGANQTGGTAAATLRAEGYTGEVVLVGEDPNPPYERPALSKDYLAGTKEFDEVITRPAAFYAEQRIHTRFGRRAVCVQTEARVVELDNGEQILYDQLLLATGARNRRPLIRGLDLRGVHELRSLADADRLRGEARLGAHVVVLGMGFIGSEVAAALRAAGLRVTIVELLDLPLAGALGVEIGTALRDLHRAHGVELRLGTRVTALTGTDRVRAVVLATGEEISCDLVVFGFGVEPAIELAKHAGLAVGDGIEVDAQLRTSAPHVYAAGDVVSQQHPILGRPLRVEHWQNAVLQGQTAARNMLGQGVVHDEVPWFWSNQYDQVVHYAGFHEPWDRTVVRGDPASGRGVVFQLADGVLVGVAALNVPRDVRFAMNMIKRRAVVDPAALADESVNLRNL